jgi:hypothetical protein
LLPLAKYICWVCKERRTAKKEESNANRFDHSKRFGGAMLLVTLAA